jgi:hypothetical protein
VQVKWRWSASAAVIVVVVAALAWQATAQTPGDNGSQVNRDRDPALSIREIQETTDPNGASPYDGYVVDCLGGVCVAKYGGYRPRVFLQDPSQPAGWGGIQIKDWIASDGYALFNDVQVGDWVMLTNMLVEEFRGTTMLQRQSAYNPGYEIISQGNLVQEPLLVSVSEIPAPIYDPNTFGWYVENHDAEPYESMLLAVRDVVVTEMDLGKAQDNYVLEDRYGSSCWAADYMNADIGPWGYHPLIEIGRHFCEVSGIFEQYTNIYDGWDYYQLVTLSSDDLDVLCQSEIDAGGVALTGAGFQNQSVPEMPVP